MDDKDLAVIRTAWARASTFPVTKELAYPELAGVQEFDEHHGKDVLEYGCGAGSDALSYFRRGNYVTCCDITPDNLYVARCNIEKAGFLRDAEFKLLDKSFPIPFPDNYFDLVNSNGVIHHIPQGSEVIGEFFRVLKPGGLCYIMLYTEFLWTRFEDTINRLELKENIDQFEAFSWCTDGKGTPYARPYTEAEGISMLESKGFEVVSIKMYNNNDFREYKAIKK